VRHGSAVEWSGFGRRLGADVGQGLQLGKETFAARSRRRPLVRRARGAST